MQKKKILVAIDGSQLSDKVIDQAIDFAKLLDTDLLLVFCHERFPTLLGEPYRDKEIASILKRSEQLVTPYLNKIRDRKVEVEERLMEEPAGKAISEVAKAEQCVMIIMGSRGLSDLAHLVVGSVTNRVLQTAPCSVLVVR